MPLALGAADKIDADKVGMLYEYMDKAGPRSVNGYPCFFSFRWLDKRDSRRVVTLYNRNLFIKKLLGGFRD